MNVRRAKTCILAIASVAALAWPLAPALAVPPPDFVFKVGAGAAQVFSVLAVGGAFAVAIARRVFRRAFMGPRKATTLALAAVAILVVATAGASVYRRHMQDQAFRSWLERSRVREAPAPATADDLAVSVDDLQLVVESGGKPFVLDVREDEERELGLFPGSLQMRYADLRAGGWSRLPQDEIVYVMCLASQRARDIAAFLNDRGVQARYVTGGADAWERSGGAWDEGSVPQSAYADDRYHAAYPTEWAMRNWRKGYVFVDARDPEKIADARLPGSIPISVLRTPSDRLEAVLALVPPHSTVVTVCDDAESCFDAQIAGIKLEKRGHTFLGRYATPWELASP